MPDLEGFDDIDGLPADTKAPSFATAAKALKYLDANWYVRVSRKARWMDLIGDYAGDEPFILDGESLIQLVLDDSLLALGRPNSIDFQILHALYTLENILNAFLTRSAVFEIVFWEDLRHLTILTGQSTSVVRARAFARRMLFNHLLTLPIPIHTFTGTTDPGWIQLQNVMKPMFIMLNDGGVLGDNTAFAAERLLTQRAFLFEVLSRGLAISLLKGAEFQDSKILSFVFEQSSSGKEAKLAASLTAAITAARSSLDHHEIESRHRIETTPLSSTIKVQNNLEQWLVDCCRLLHPMLCSQVDFDLVFLFIIHCLVLDAIPVEDRARPKEILNPELISYMSKSFLPQIFLAGECATSSTTLVPHIDGRVLASLIKCLITSCIGHHLDIEQIVGTNACRRASAIWSSAFSRVSLPDLVKFASRFPLPQSQQELAGTNTKPLQLLPFSNDTFNAELSSIIIATGDLNQDQLELSTKDDHFHLGLRRGITFPDTQHWHDINKAILPRHLGGEDPKPQTQYEKGRALRRTQRFMATLQKHAGTLTGASGSILQQIVIPPVSSKGRDHIKKRQSKVPRSSNASNQKAKPLSSAERLRNKIADDKGALNDKKLTQSWKENINKMMKMSPLKRMDWLKTLERNKEFHTPSLATEFQLFTLHLHLTLWIDDDARETDAARDRYTVAIIRLVKSIADQNTVTPTVSKALSSVLITLGLADYVPTLATPSLADDKPIHFDFVKLLRSKTGNTSYYEFMRIKEHPVIWQLRLFGEYMDRSMDSQPDPRVSFEPDAWQRTVLDAIDENASLLVIAPTSAGKTFISFYAMEKVLRESDDGILVYIAPTKALVTQIAAEIYARFSKNLNGRSCWAVHTRDYRINNPLNCQILVTVPEVLGILLLSPPMARVWTPRIKRIVLDEIHSIGQQEGGAIWEQIILLALCPIIGLSATIGSPEKFNEWLRSVQDAHGHKYIYIHHQHRYSHLRKFYYDLQTNPRLPFAGLNSHKSSNRARFLHPVAMLSFGTRALPSDLAFEASDTLTLHRALVAQKDGMSADIDMLEPTTFFQDPVLLRQKDIIRYEHALKKVVTQMAKEYDPQQANSPLYNVINTLSDQALSQAAKGISPSVESFKSNLIHLVSDLHVGGHLPAILFNFNRTECEIMAKALLNSLVAAEEKWRETSPEWKQKLEQFNAWQSASKERQRQTERAKRRPKDVDDLPETQTSPWENFDPNDPLPQFSFAGSRTGYSKSDFEEDASTLRRFSTPGWVIGALRRGIAVHHAGMNKGYRTLVESLFRRRFIRVVIATGTLALGINAPTKTSVFCGDSPFLTALMYRQCAGRAGRRGFDLLGHVVFYGLPMDRVQRIILSKLPSLGGSFPLTSTLILRLFNLLEGSGYHEGSTKAVRSLLTLPKISLGSDMGRDQVLHHVRFSIEYLRRARLLDQHGKPMNFFTLANHLHYTEPSNFALVVLLRQGVLHRICNQPEAKRDFISLMAHLFGRRYIPKVYFTKDNLEAIIKRSPSMVLLPPLRNDAREALVSHDQEILRIFTAYALTFASEHAADLGRDCQLPLGKGAFLGDGDGDGEVESESESTGTMFRQHLRATAIRVTARSVFVANSGHTDHTFRSIKELASTARRGVHLGAHAILSMGHLTAARSSSSSSRSSSSESSSESSESPGVEETSFGLNAYLLDFYIHGQTAALVAANGIRRGELWYALQDFVLSLKVIRGAVLELLKASRPRPRPAPNKGGAGRGEEEAEAEDGDQPVVWYDSSEGSDGEEGEGEGEEEREVRSGGDDKASVKKPARVSEEDWKVYKMIDEATNEFDEKFRAMWA